MLAAALLPATAHAQSNLPPGERLDRDSAAVANAFTTFDGPPLQLLAPPEARQTPSIQDAYRTVASSRNLTPVEPVATKRQVVILGGTGANQLVVRIFAPRGADPKPLLVYFPGGGWTISALNNYEPSARALANASGHIVALVSHRLAPENKFPAAAEDAYAALQFFAQNAAAFGGIRGRVAVGGESAGGNLAAVAANLARDRGGIEPFHQLLVYPITNFDFSTPSYRTEADSIPLSRPGMEYFWSNYLSTPADGASPLASPLRANLAGVAPATVITSENDPLRSEGEAYARKLRAAGVRVRARRYAGTFHEFFGMTRVVRKARLAVDLAGRELRRSARRAASADRQTRSR